MGLGRFSEGWGGVRDSDNDNGGNGGSGGGGLSDNERLYKFRFSIPAPDGGKKKNNLVPGAAATKRVLFLGGKPFNLYEHGLWVFKNAFDVLGSYTCTCLVKSDLVLDRECPICSGRDSKGNKIYPYYIGFFPVIDMGQVEMLGDGKIRLHHEFYEKENGTRVYRAFERKLLGAKLGSKDKPGVLKKLFIAMEKLKSKKGMGDLEDLTGTVWDTTRSGEKDPSVGDTWEFVDRLRPNEYEQYLVDHGALKDELNLKVPVWTNGHDGVFDVNIEWLLRKQAELFGTRTSGSSTVRARVEGASFGGGYEDAPPPGDDDIPF